MTGNIKYVGNGYCDTWLQFEFTDLFTCIVDRIVGDDFNQRNICSWSDNESTCVWPGKPYVMGI